MNKTTFKARNAKHEARNKYQARNSKDKTPVACSFGHSVIWYFEFVSNFVLRSSCFAFLFGMATAAEPFPRVPPTPPEKAEATFEVQHGFRMELIAAEPLVVDPVDMAYDEDGRAYVVEMRDYPYPEEKNAAPMVFPATVRLIEDTDGDGKFDKSTVFADQLAWPTSVCCYKGGVFVAAAPDIWYFKDTDGDRKADVRRKVFTGFSRYNVQAIMNSLRWGLDNKIYGSASGNGGTVRHADRANDPVIQLTRRDFRFDPVTELIEAISGGERYGATFDDWGNRFLCNIRNPVQHVVLPLHYLARNPHLVVPSVIHDAAESGDQLRVYRISPPEAWREFRAQRWALEQANMPRSELIGAGYWTSSSGVCVYRGGAYPEEFRGNVFIGEVAGNLVHRQILTRDGVTFKSRRADENTEFVRSRDNWFRPVNFVNAPDGTLNVLDMYRETIEHPWSIPDDIKAQLDLSSGNDRGRIYRLAPPGFKSPKPPKLSTATTAQLVAHLESPHSWYRETAQRLLFERQEKSATESLRTLLANSKSPQSRLHALHLLSGLGELTDDDVQRGLRDSEPAIRVHSVRFAEPAIREVRSVQPVNGRILKTLATADAAIALSNDNDPIVRFQVALSLGEVIPEISLFGLNRIASRDADDPWTRMVILSSALPVADKLALTALDTHAGGVSSQASAVTLRRELAALVGAEGKSVTMEGFLTALSKINQHDVVFACLSGLGQGLARRRERLSDRIAKLPADAQEPIERQIAQATAQASNQNVDAPARAAAIQLLGYLAWNDVHPPLVACLAPSEPRDIQQTALRVLGSFNEPTVAGELVSRWKQLTPPLREETVTVLLSRPIWQEPLIGALEKGEIPIAQVSIPQRTRLAAIRDEKLAERAKKILASFALGPRKEVIDRYQESLMLQGDSSRGQVVYRRECLNCHKMRGEGHDVGPSLETVQHRSPQEILIHVLDPNREVSPQFLDYAVRLTDGRVLTGLIAAETDAGLTLRRAQNQEDTVLRSEIDDITSSGKSLMPEGLEQKITPQEMADIIVYLRQPVR
jgi:putative membrane-bound dehydrogenase-like protein